MRGCGKRYDDADQAARSKAGQRPGMEPVACRCGGWHLRAAGPGNVVPLARTRIAPVSGRRRAQNRQRAAIVAVLFPPGTLCAVPGCGRLFDDVHEPLTRGRGGSITDPANMAPLCRPHHDQITFRPEKSELAWAYRLGLLRHAGVCCDGRPVCARYEQGEAA